MVTLHLGILWVIVESEEHWWWHIFFFSCCAISIKIVRQLTRWLSMGDNFYVVSPTSDNCGLLAAARGKRVWFRWAICSLNGTDLWKLCWCNPFIVDAWAALIDVLVLSSLVERLIANLVMLRHLSIIYEKVDWSSSLLVCHRGWRKLHVPSLFCIKCILTLLFTTIERPLIWFIFLNLIRFSTSIDIISNPMIEF